jgi:hypothetical protein
VVDFASLDIGSYSVELEDFLFCLLLLKIPHHHHDRGTEY